MIRPGVTLMLAVLLPTKTHTHSSNTFPHPPQATRRSKPTDTHEAAHALMVSLLHLDTPAATVRIAQQALLRYSES